MGLIFKNLMFEITRKCNMNCEHCMRGEQQDITMSSEVIKNVLDVTSEIDNLTLTGGEPSLAPNVIRCIVYHLKSRGIKLGSFFCATNAALYSEEFVNQLNELYKYSQNKEKCALSISIDQFHKNTDEKAIREYRSLPYYSREKEIGYIPDGDILDEGRADKNEIGNFNIPIEEFIYNYGVTGFNIYVGDRIYINALGYVFLNADLSYESQQEGSIGNVFNLPLETILKQKFHVLSDSYFKTEEKRIYCIHISAENGTFCDEALDDRKYYTSPRAAVADYRNILNNIRISPTNSENGRPVDLFLNYSKLPITETRCEGTEIIYLQRDIGLRRVVVEILIYHISEDVYVR